MLERIGRNRKYKSGTTWCVWRWTDVDSEYIVRLHVLKTPWFAICLHWIFKPDPEPYLHDHPVSFLSIILRGGYTEWRGTRDNSCPDLRAEDELPGLGRRTHRWFNWIRANDEPENRHSICDVRPHTLSLALMGPKVREWGFSFPTGEWCYWKDYYKAQRAARGGAS